MLPSKKTIKAPFFFNTSVGCLREIGGSVAFEESEVIMAYDLIKISGLPLVTPDSGQDIVVGVGDYAKRINYGDVKADMVGTSPSYTTDTEPYLMRRTAHVGVVGKCALNKLVGGSLGWNQMIPHTASTGTSAGFTFTNNGDGSWTITGTGTNNNAFLNLDYVSGQNCFIANHVYLIVPNQSGATTLSSVGVRVYGLKETTSPYETYVPYIVKCVASPTSTGYTRLQVSNGNGINIGTVKLTPQVFDLTQMFGSTVADYIVGLGQTDGLAWLSRYIDLGTYHAYDAGSIQSVQATAHVMKDANDNVIGNYPLGSDTLRGIPQLVSNKLKYDGDEKYPDGTIRRRYGIVDLGSLNWNIGGTGTYRRFYTSETNLAKTPSTQNDDVNIICDSYVASPFNTLLTTDKRISINTTGAINISDSAYASSTAAQFKTAMSGKYLVYEKATESTESSTSYQKIQTIDADGTESFTTSTPVPVGHETQTPDNILAALGWLGE